jgi:hypothetical protein
MNLVWKDKEIENLQEVGVIVGRYQVPELTEAHRILINAVIARHTQCILVIGISNKRTPDNPLSYEERFEMIHEIFPSILIIPLADVTTDSQWSINLNNLIEACVPKQPICLYGGRDSFIKSYSGKHKTFEFGLKHPQVGLKLGNQLN